MSGSKLSEAREVTHELGDRRPLSSEGGEMQEAIDIGEEVGTDGAIGVEVGTQVGVDEALVGVGHGATQVQEERTLGVRRYEGAPGTGARSKTSIRGTMRLGTRSRGASTLEQ
ncbi:unnamed protein product, partial [Ilex paraguariensis]